MIFLGSIEIGLACEFLHTQRHFGRTFILPRSRGAAFLHSQDPKAKSSLRGGRLAYALHGHLDKTLCLFREPLFDKLVEMGVVERMHARRQSLA